MRTQSPARARSVSPNTLLATLIGAGVTVLLLAFAATTARSQTQPSVNAQATNGGSNLLFQLPTEAGWFYTLQQSSTLTNWGYAADLFAGDISLNFTNAIASNSSAKYFRVMVNSPNPGAATNAYHSWTNVVSVNNGVVEALICPTDGRLQQFRFFGETNGAFWENSSLYGHVATNTGGYQDFGADKAWPSPQGNWPVSGNWPPPNGFDRNTNAVTFSNGVVTVVTPVSSVWGIQTTRVIEMLFNEPTMRVRNIFNRVTNSTQTNTLGVWIDCEVNISTNSRCYVPVPSPSIFSNGFTTNGSPYYSALLPAAYTNTNSIISFGVDTKIHKMGFDSGTIVLVGTNLCIRVDSTRVAGSTYPDGNASTEVYCNGSTDFELEELGPMSLMPVGTQIEFDEYYSLFHRSQPTTDAEAQQILQWQY